MTVLFYECYTVLFKIFSEGAFVKQALNGTIISEKNRAKVTKIVYGVLDKNIELDYCLSHLCSKNPKNSVKIILKIAFYNLKYLSKQPYAVTDATVSLLKKMGKGGMAGFANAVLRKFITNKIEMPTEKVQGLSIKYSYPQFLIERLLKKYSIDEVENIIKCDQEKTTVRFIENGEEYLRYLGYEYERTPFENVYFVKGFKMEDGFYQGKYTFQSIGSVAICDIAKGNGRLLDACSAPGGKAVNLSRFYERVDAWDIHAHRVELIKAYAKRMGAEVNARACDASQLHEECESLYDTVLCDVPCSGTGVIKDNPDIKLNRSEQSIEELKSLQYKILSACSHYVKTGGYLVYSTCSILPEENEENIKKFLLNGNFEVDLPKTPLNGLIEEYGITFLPHISQGAGFFCTRLRRIK